MPRTSRLAVPGAGGGLYNSTANYSFNSMPDVILKAAFEPGFGHYEVFGILQPFPRPRLSLRRTTCRSSTLQRRHRLHARRLQQLEERRWNRRQCPFHFAKHLDFGLHASDGNGVGRYGTAGLPDATVNADGTLAPLRSYQGLVTLEYHMPRFDIYLNGGEEYVKRRWQIDPVSGKPVGYGSPLVQYVGLLYRNLAGSGHRIRLRGLGELQCRHAKRHRRFDGFLGAHVQRAQRKIAVWSAIFLPEPWRMVRHGWRAARGREHVLHLVPLLLAVTRAVTLKRSDRSSVGIFPAGAICFCTGILLRDYRRDEWATQLCNLSWPGSVE